MTSPLVWVPAFSQPCRRPNRAHGRTRSQSVQAAIELIAVAIMRGRQPIAEVVVQQPGFQAGAKQCIRQDRLIGEHSDGKGVQTLQTSMGFRCIKHPRVRTIRSARANCLPPCCAPIRASYRRRARSRQRCPGGSNRSPARCSAALHHRCRIGIRQRLDQDLVEVDFALGTTGVEPAQAAHQPGARDTAQTSNRMRHHLSGDTFDRCGGKFRSIDLVADHRPTVAVRSSRRSMVSVPARPSTPHMTMTGGFPGPVLG